MPLLRHIFFWLATAISLAIFVLTAISFGWNDPRTLRDLYVTRSDFWQPMQREVQFESTDVAYRVYRFVPLATVDKGPEPHWSPEHSRWISHLRTRDTAIFFLGFHYDKQAHFGLSDFLDGYEYNVGVRYATVFVLSAILPALAVLRVVRWRRARSAVRMGLCPACGYDLRATSDRCPECGTRVPSKA